MRAMDAPPPLAGPDVAGLPGVGPRPPGDPEGMRALADDLRRIAARVEGHETIRLENWESPAARVVKAQLAAAGRAADGASDRLRGLARRLDAAAADVQDAQLAWAERYALALHEQSSIPRSKI
jgi:hypothetical protein